MAVDSYPLGDKVLDDMLTTAYRLMSDGVPADKPHLKQDVLEQIAAEAFKAGWEKARSFPDATPENAPFLTTGIGGGIGLITIMNWKR